MAIPTGRVPAVGGRQIRKVKVKAKIKAESQGEVMKATLRKQYASSFETKELAGMETTAGTVMIPRTLGALPQVL